MLKLYLIKKNNNLYLNIRRYTGHISQKLLNPIAKNISGLCVLPQSHKVNADLLKKVVAKAVIETTHNLYANHQGNYIKSIFDVIPRINNVATHYNSLNNKTNFMFKQHFLNLFLSDLQLNPKLLTDTCNFAIDYSRFNTITSLQVFEANVLALNYSELFKDPNIKFLALNPENLTALDEILLKDAMKHVGQQFSDFALMYTYKIAKYAKNIQKTKTILMDVKCPYEPEKSLATAKPYISISSNLDTKLFNARVLHTITNYQKTEKYLLASLEEQRAINQWSEELNLKKNTSIDIFYSHIININQKYLLDPSIQNFFCSSIKQSFENSSFKHFVEKDPLEFNLLLNNVMEKIDLNFFFPPTNSFLNSKDYLNYLVKEVITLFDYVTKEEMLYNIEQINKLLTL